MPPAVAHAPIVTRNRDAARTRWIRSASCGVPIEPSTSDRSYGPSITSREASGKEAMSIAPATSSSSSSQFKSESWQPSQEANFHTASVGLRAATHHTSRVENHGAIAGYGNTGPSRHTRKGPNWQCPHIATAHCMLRSIDKKTRSAGTPACVQRVEREPHHDLGPDHEGHDGGRIELRTGDQAGHHPDVPSPHAHGRIAGHLDLQVEAAPPRRKLVGEQQVRRGPGAVKQRDPPVGVAVGEQVIEGGAQRGQPDAPRDDHHVAALGLRHRPTGAVGPAHPGHLAGLEFAQRVRDGPDVADRVRHRDLAPRDRR